MLIYINEWITSYYYTNTKSFANILTPCATAALIGEKIILINCTRFYVVLAIFQPNKCRVRVDIHKCNCMSLTLIPVLFLIFEGSPCSESDSCTPNWASLTSTCSSKGKYFQFLKTPRPNARSNNVLNNIYLSYLIRYVKFYYPFKELILF